jgi:hypothetical protein
MQGAFDSVAVGARRATGFDRERSSGTSTRENACTPSETTTARSTPSRSTETVWPPEVLIRPCVSGLLALGQLSLLPPLLLSVRLLIRNISIIESQRLPRRPRRPHLSRQPAPTHQLHPRHRQLRRRVIVFDLSTFVCLFNLLAHDNSITCLQFNDRFIVSGGNDGRLKLWDLRSGAFVRELTKPCKAIWRVTFNDDKCVVLLKRGGRPVMEASLSLLLLPWFELGLNSFPSVSASGPDVPSSRPRALEGLYSEPARTMLWSLHPPVLLRLFSSLC